MIELRIITDADFGGKEIMLPGIDRVASRGILYNKDGKIAVMRIRELGCYKLPGGGVEQGESIEDAFKREIMEETGFNSEITRELGYIDEHKSRAGFCQRSYCYAGRALEKGRQALTEKEEGLGLELEWMGALEALEKLELYVRSFDEYTIKFMFLRDASIVKRAIETRIMGSVTSSFQN